MKKLLIFLCGYLLLANFTYGQNVSSKSIIGTWQVSSAQTGTDLLAHYDFFPNGSFTYTFSAYDNTSRIREAGGTYKLTGNKLSLNIKYRIEIVGGSLVQGGMGFQQEELVLEGGKRVKVPQVSKDFIEITIEKCKSSGKAQCMKLQNNIYYQVSTTPKK